MQLERIAATLRPRHAWEAVDLGLALLQRERGAVAKAWAVTVLPLSVIVLLALREHFLIAAFALWWLRPMFERVPLWVLSRALFGATPSTTELLRELPRLWRRALFRGLFLHRLHVARGIVQPIALLEGDGHESLGARERVLLRDGGTAVVVALTCWVFELLLFASALLLVVFLTPGEFLPDSSAFSETGPLAFDYGWFGWVARLAWLGAYSITGPLHAATGFGLYISRRVQVEGWDVDLAFQRLAARLERAARLAVGVVAALCIALAMALLAPRAGAQQQDPAQVARTVLAGDDFKEELVKQRWRLRRGADSSSDFDFAPRWELLAGALEFLMWVVIGALLVGLVLLLARYAGWIRRRSPRPDEAGSALPTHLSGLDLRPESLPADIAASARELWRRGAAAAALGLLYRAAISRLIERDGLQLEASDTESDCLRRVRALADAARAAYFSGVTGAWQTCAYSTARPSDERVEGLCDDWNDVFERRPA